MKHTYRLAAVIGAVAIAVGVALGGGAANAAPSPTPKPSAKPSAKPTAKPSKKPTPKPTVRKPFRVGWTNQNAGASPAPGMTDGFQAAVQYINKNGGINGRVIEIVPCYTDQTPQTAQTCGNQFANDSSLNLVMLGLNNVAGPLFDALKPSGTPVLIAVPSTPVDFNAPNAVAYNGGGAVVAGSAVAIAKKEGAKTVAVIAADSASGHQLSDAIAKQMPSNVTLTRVFVTLPYTDPLPILLQAKAASADLIVNSLGVVCLPLLKAMKQLGIPASRTSRRTSPRRTQRYSIVTRSWLISVDFLVC